MGLSKTFPRPILKNNEDIVDLKFLVITASTVLIKKFMCIKTQRNTTRDPVE